MFIFVSYPDDNKHSGSQFELQTVRAKLRATRMMQWDCYDLVRATRGARNPNLQVALRMRRMYVASIRLIKNTNKLISSLLALFFLNFFVLCFLPTSPSFIQIPQNEILWITILPVFSQFLWTLRFIFSGFGKRSSLVLLQIANYRKSSIKPPLSNKPLLSNKRPLFRGGKLISPPLY